jgi:hypothetical protein
MQNCYCEDIIVEDHPTTSSNRPSVDLISAMGNEHKKTSSSISTSSVATLKRKGSSDSFKTVLSSPLQCLLHHNLVFFCRTFLNFM